MAKINCIIGTGTEIGKTYATCQILDYLAQQGKQVTAIKPIATGKINTVYGNINEDAYQLYQYSKPKCALSQINPICFDEPIAPHIAANRCRQSLTVNEVAAKIAEIKQSLSNYDQILIEGVGGLLVPFNNDETYLDLLKKLNFSVILVVGVMLGCLNHTLLTIECLKKNNINVGGWIANCIDPNMNALSENIDFLKMKLHIPLLAVVPHAQCLMPTSHFTEVFL